MRTKTQKKPAAAPPTNGQPKPPKVKFIVRCTPTLGSVSIWWAKACEELLMPMNYIKAVSYMQDVVGDEVAECRNKLVAQVLGFNSLQHEVSAIFWVDDDVIVTRGALMQLMSHNKDIASGVYFTKLPGVLSEPLIFPSKSGGTDRFIPAGNDGQRSYPVWGHGMGLTLVKPDVYVRMDRELKLPKDKYGNPEWYRKTGRPEDIKVQASGNDKTPAMLDCGGTEDLYFLDLAGKLGYQPVIDCSKHAFGFHHDRHTGKGYPEKQWNQYKNHQPITWDTPDGVVTWE